MCKDIHKPQQNPAISYSFLQELINKHKQPKELKHIPKYSYFMGLIYKGQKQPATYVPISNLLLRKVIRQPIITRLKDNLLSWGVIECNYKKRFEIVKGKPLGKEPYSYRLTPDYYKLIQGNNYYNRDGFDIQTNNPNPLDVKPATMYNRVGFSDERLNALRDKFDIKVVKAHQDRWCGLVNLAQKPEYRFIRENALKLEIDPNVYEFINNQLNDKVKLKPTKCEFNRQGKRIFYLNKNRVFNEEIANLWRGYAEKIERGEFQFSCPASVNRVYYNITSMPSELRKFLRYQNRALYYLDYSNFQPFLFNKILNEKYPHDKPVDVSNYIKLTSEGRFYAEVKRLFEAEELEIKDHDNFKIDFFARVFFSSEKRKYEYRSIFEKHFPNVSATITEAKQGNYKSLSIQLQRLESEIVINTILREIAEQHPKAFVLPIHDAIICQKEMFVYVERLMLEKSSQIVGFKPNIKFEILTSTNN